MTSNIEYYCYPLTQRPPPIAEDIAQVFQAHEQELSTETLSREDSLNSNQVLEKVRPGLEDLGFDVETGKKAKEKVLHPASFRKNGEYDNSFEVDGYHKEKGCVIEIEAGRAWDSNHTHRNLIRAMTMVDVETLVMAVPHKYKHSNSTTKAFKKSREIAETLYRTGRIDVPFKLVLLGY